MFPSKQILLAFAATAFLAGCGGGADSIAPPVLPKAIAKGVMIDGYVSGATVFCDANGNGELDTGETTTETNAKGGYLVPGGCDATVVGYGGVNVDTGFAFTGKLAAPKGSTVITPLTTLLATSTLTNDQLVALLGLKPGTDITNVDIANGENPELLKATLAVQQMIADIVRIVSSASTGVPDVKGIYGRISQGLAVTLAAPGTPPLISATGDFNSSLVTTFAKSLPDVKSLQISDANLNATINSVVAQAQMFAKASPADLLTLTKTLQDPAKAPISTTPPVNFLSLVDDSVSVNGTKVSLATLNTGTPVTGLTTLGFKLNVNGSPAADVTTSLALELIEQGGNGLKLQLLLDQVQLKLNQTNQLSVSFPAGAKLYAYSRASNGVETITTLDALSIKPITVTDNGFSLNYSGMVNKALNSVGNSSASAATAQSFINLKGTFNIKVVMDKVSLRHMDSSALTNQMITVTNTPQSVIGAGFSGTLVIN